MGCESAADEFAELVTPRNRIKGTYSSPPPIPAGIANAAMMNTRTNATKRVSEIIVLPSP